MGKNRQMDVWQYGDFQTPLDLASAVCERLTRMGVQPSAVVEPTCGRGVFLAQAAERFPGARTLIGADINARYVEEARQAVIRKDAEIERRDFFQTDWESVLGRNAGPWLVLGNPPWVTNTELCLIESTNLPAKSNFQGHRGLEALTGKANFDISEWMLLQQVDWLRKRPGWIAMLVKTAVARKVLGQVWKAQEVVGRAAIFKVDAMHHFGASVDACLFVLPVGVGNPSQDCDLFDGLEDDAPSGSIGYHHGFLVSDVDAFTEHHGLIEANEDYAWRSGIKHDCSRVMELSRDADGHLVNGLGELVDIEDAHLFPMLKSSDVANRRLRPDRFMVVPQREIGADTLAMETTASRTWAYLSAHGDRLNARRSVIYRDKPRFSIFGVGGYTFAPWKIAVSGFYKAVRFVKVGAVAEKPVVFDDTVYFLPCWSEGEADFVLTLLQSEPFMELMRSMIFLSDKRPITTGLLNRISLERVAEAVGRSALYERFKPHRQRQKQFAFG